jgi:hypothetical protein
VGQKEMGGAPSYQRVSQTRFAGLRLLARILKPTRQDSGTKGQEEDRKFFPESRILFFWILNFGS